MDGKVTIGLELETKEFDKQILSVERRIEEIEKELSDNKELGFLSEREVADLNVELEKTKNKLVSLYNQKIKLEEPSNKDTFKGFNSSLDKAVKKAGRLALSIFGIRTAYMMLRRASSDLAGYDEQYAANLEYIRFALTQAIAPILRYIVNLAATLLGYINAIAQAWFGVNLFANGSVEAFNKMKRGASGVGKAVKEIRKQLLGFDEINVLTDQSDTGTSAGAGGVSPDFDLSGIGDEKPEWLQWIIDNKDLATIALEAIATALLALKYGLDLVQGAGLFLVIDGIKELVEDIKEFAEDPSVQNGADILRDVGEILLGFSAIFGEVPLALVGLLVTGVSDIVSAIGSLLDMIEDPSWKNFRDLFKNTLNIFVIGRSLNDIIDAIAGAWDDISATLETVGDWINENVIIPVQDFFNTFVFGVEADSDALWQTIKEIFFPAIGWFEKLFTSISNGFEDEINSVKNTINFFVSKVQYYVELVKQYLLDLWNKITQKIEAGKQKFNDLKETVMNIATAASEFFSSKFSEAVQRIKNIFNGLITFFSGIWNNITSMFRNVGIAIGDAIGGTLKNAINGVLGAVERILNTPIRTINSLIYSIRQVPRIRRIKNIKYI